MFQNRKISLYILHYIVKESQKLKYKLCLYIIINVDQRNLVFNEQYNLESKNLISKYYLYLLYIK